MVKTTKKQDLQSLKGMHDILPADQLYWSHILKKAKTLFEDYGFERIDTPIVEQAGLFEKATGETTDVVQKEMYTFKIKGGEAVALRPEFTPGIVRAYLEHGMQVMPHPVQLWTFGPLFRHDNPQAGRYRQFYQLNIEMFGDDSAAADAQVIFLGYKILESVGLKNVMVRLNSIGDADCRPSYLKALKDYFRGRDKKLCANCQGRLKTNPLRVLDCKVEGCRELTKDTPQFLDYLDDTCKRHFKEVLEFLDEIRVPYLLDHRLVRGLDYYTRTTFEYTVDGSEETGAPALPSQGGQSALGGGGRYDRLMAFMGGPKTPALGWALGVERIILALKERNVVPSVPHVQPKVFLAQLGEMAKRKSLTLFEAFRTAGIPAKASFGRDSIKSQLKIANRLGIKYTLIMGHKEALEGTIILREMDSGVQETVPVEKIVELIKIKLRKDHEH